MTLKQIKSFSVDDSTLDKISQVSIQRDTNLSNALRFLVKLGFAQFIKKGA